MPLAMQAHTDLLLKLQHIIDDDDKVFQELEHDSARLFSADRTCILASNENSTRIITDEVTLDKHLEASRL